MEADLWLCWHPKKVYLGQTTHISRTTLYILPISVEQCNNGSIESPSRESSAITVPTVLGRRRQFLVGGAEFVEFKKTRHEGTLHSR
jgi:hypothetical protein